MSLPAVGPSRDLWLVSRDGAAERKLTSTDHLQALPIEWTLDGRFVLFMRELWTGEPSWSQTERSLWSVAVTGSARQLLSWDDLHRPELTSDVALSPGGVRVAVKSSPGSGDQSGVWIIDVGSGASRQIRQSGRIGSLAWSSDSTKLAYAKDGLELWIADINEEVSAELLWRVPR